MAHRFEIDFDSNDFSIFFPLGKLNGQTLVEEWKMISNNILDEFWN